MPKINPYLIKLPETETISYFNENEWNKDLSVEEVEKREQLAELIYRDNLLHDLRYGPCSYSQNTINGRHIDICRSSNCVYYKEIVDNHLIDFAGNTAKAVIGAELTTAATLGFWGSMMAIPFTGGLSALGVVACSTGAAASLVGGTALTMASMSDGSAILDRIENELKLKWEEEKRSREREEERVKRLEKQQREEEIVRERQREKTRKINNLRGQLDEKRRDLEITNEKMDMCKSDSEYTREKQNKDQLENQIRSLRNDLCKAKEYCNCNGYCS